jgi:transcription elongation factor GreB
MQGLYGRPACYYHSAMSKAFTKENDEPEELEFEEEPPQPAGAKNYITPAGYNRLKEEFNELWEKERPKLVETIAWAAANGDRSENADYQYGKRRLREVDRRIRFLSKRLEFAEIVDNSTQEHDRIFFGATVTYADEQGAERTVSIVGIDEVDPSRGRVSWISPIAKALIKAREGDRVILRTPAGPQNIEVLAVKYEELS